MSATARERQLRAQVAAHSRWAKVEDRTAATEPARQRLFEKYLHRADPDGVLPEDERIRRATSLRKADLARLAVERLRARRERELAELFTDDSDAA